MKMCYIFSCEITIPFDVELNVLVFQVPYVLTAVWRVVPYECFFACVSVGVVSDWGIHRRRVRGGNRFNLLSAS